MVTSESYSLICESPDETQPLEVVREEKSLNKPGCLYVQGPYMGGGVVNKNNRLYPIEEMRIEVNNFIINKVNKHQATGELNHPEHANLDLKQAAHLITKMWEDNNVWYGKSKILNDTPNGELLKSLLNNGVAIGMSSRCLGQLSESGEGYSTVHNMKMITVDAVADPSFDKAFVNGILESKRFVCECDGSIRMENLYNSTEDKLRHLPRGGQNQFIKECMIEFIKSFNK